MELEELHVLQGDPASVRDREAVAREGVSVRGDPEHPPVAAGREQDGLRSEHVELSGRQLVRDHAGRAAVFGEQEVQAVELVEEPDVALHALLVERLQDHVPGAVGRVARALDGPLTVVGGVSAEAPLVDQSLRGPIERETPSLELVDRVDGLLGQDLGGGLVHEVVATLHRVEGMPFGVVLLDVAERGADAALGSTRVGSGGVELRDHGRLHAAGRLDRGSEPCAAGADDHGVVRVGGRHVVGHFVGSNVTTMIVPRTISAAPRTAKNPLIVSRTLAGRT